VADAHRRIVAGLETLCLRELWSSSEGMFVRRLLVRQLSAQRVEPSVAP
jgi:hypothetical protein